MKPGVVAHLAAQAGVRYSLEAPHAYTASNLVALGHVLECCRQHAVRHLVFASSSSVYGANPLLPFSEHHGADHPLSLYAATKRAGELMAYSYAHLYALPFTGLRFFTVYGPWGRPDMALFKFTKAILSGEPIDVYHQGESARDYTYVDDVVEAFVRVLDRPPGGVANSAEGSMDPAAGPAPFRVYNIGQQSPVKLTRMIEVLESCLGRTAQRRLMPAATGRRRHNECRWNGPRARHGFRASRHRRGRHPAIRGVVPALLRREGLTVASLPSRGHARVLVGEQPHRPHDQRAEDAEDRRLGEVVLPDVVDKLHERAHGHQRA